MCGEVRREEVADLLGPVIQTLMLQQQLMAASLGPGHAQAVARAGTFKTSTYCWMKRRESKNDFIAVFLSPQCDQIFIFFFLFICKFS